MNSITKAGTISRTAPPKRRKKQPPAPAGRQIPEALTPAPAHPKILPAMIAAIQLEAPAATAIRKLRSVQRNLFYFPRTKSRMLEELQTGTGQRLPRRSVTDEQIANNSSSDSTKGINKCMPQGTQTNAPARKSPAGAFLSHHSVSQTNLLYF